MKFIYWVLSGFVTCFVLTTVAVGFTQGVLIEDDRLTWAVSAASSFWNAGSLLMLFAAMLIVQISWVLLARSFYRLDRTWRSVFLGLFALTVVVSLGIQAVVGGISTSEKALGFFLFWMLWVMLGVGVGLPLARLIVPGLRPGAFSRNPERTG